MGASLFTTAHLYIFAVHSNAFGVSWQEEFGKGAGCKLQGTIDYLPLVTIARDFSRITRRTKLCAIPNCDYPAVCAAAIPRNFQTAVPIYIHHAQITLTLAGNGQQL